MSARGLILEGITGAGKSSTLKALLSHPKFLPGACDVFREKDTFGEFMTEHIAAPSAPHAPKFRLLHRVVRTASDRASKLDSYRFILERAHFSYYALLPEWDLYDEFDSALDAMHAHVVLLWIPPDALRQRSLYRVDRQMWSEGFLDYYGSEAKALKEMAAVQERRYEGIRQSRIPHTVIDTSNREWDAYAQTISALSA